MRPLDEQWGLGRAELPEGPEFELTVLDAATQLIERDLNETFSCRIRAVAFLDNDGVTMCRFSDGKQLSALVHVDVDDDLAVTTARLAETVQDSDIFYGYVEPWPRCPTHASESHSLLPRRFGDGAWWVCPVGGRKVSRVGELPQIEE